MAQITLTRNNVLRLHAFVKANKTKWYIAKDEGAYVGANKGAENVLFYFRGCDPRTDANWYDNCLAQFGGDDFGEMLDPKILDQVAAMPDVTKLVLKVTPRSIIAEYHRE